MFLFFVCLMTVYSGQRYWSLRLRRGKVTIAHLLKLFAFTVPRTVLYYRYCKSQERLFVTGRRNLIEKHPSLTVPNLR